jgi:hypothetical protein
MAAAALTVAGREYAEAWRGGPLRVLLPTSGPGARTSESGERAVDNAAGDDYAAHR